jgi:eukaryotic-like serine/threonine-protein kinase
MAESWKPGRVLAGRYRLEVKIGEGGMGSIWRAEHLVLAAPVAVKLIDRDVAEDEDTIARFMREAQAAATLRSPHVVQIIDYGMDGKAPFMVMELLDGENLAQRIKRLGRLPALETARVITQVARAVGKAHEAGIMHRDLKPENVFLVKNEDDEIAKVLDFGVAKVAETKTLGPSAKTRTGSLLGTPYYMSPEQAQGNKTVDARSDLWSLGVIAFECLTGKRPFYSDALGDLVLQICVRDIPIPSSIGPVPAGFDAWFARATARDVEHRFQSARELAETLRDALGVEGRETMATLPDAEQRAAAAGQALPSKRSEGAPSDADLLHPSHAPTIAVSGNQQLKPSLTVRQFGTSSITPPPTRSGAPLVLGVAGAALVIGLVAGFVVLRQRAAARDAEQPTAPLEYRGTEIEVPLMNVPKDDPQGGLGAITADAGATDGDPRLRRDGGTRKDVRAADAGVAAAPRDAGGASTARRDGGWVKPAWAMPDEEIPKAHPPPAPSSAPAPAPGSSGR